MSIACRSALLLVLTILFLGCHHRGAPSRASSGQFSVELLLPGDGTAEQARLPIGGTLRTGDRFSLRISVVLPLYLAVVQQSASGESTPLYPQPGAAPAITAVGTPLLLPTVGTFQLDERVGRETIWVVASTARLPEETVREEIARAAATVTTEREPPPTSSTTSGRPGEVLWGGLEPRGVGVVRFRIAHQ